MKNIQWGKLFVSILLPLAAGFIGSIFTRKNIPIWYAQLEKPEFNPPNWVFGPVWTILYILMGISLYLVWKKSKQQDVSFEMNLFFFQLVLNTIWSIMFFGYREIGLAFAEIILLWLAILITIIYFYKVSSPAAYIMIPYLLWVSFASVLNFSIMRLNSN